MKALVYGLYQSGSLVYIGRSARLAARLSEHRRGSLPFTSHKVLCLCKSEKEASRQERFYIALLKPSMNKRRGGEGLYCADNRILCVTIPVRLKSHVMRQAKKYNRTMASYVRCVLRRDMEASK
jgi:hypothetical protein